MPLSSDMELLSQDMISRNQDELLAVEPLETH